MSESFRRVEMIEVSLHFDNREIVVGKFAERDRVVYFGYDPGFLATGLQISPVRLPLVPGAARFDARLFDGLPGVFHDSLPDGWGRLILDRALKAKGIEPGELSILDRLAHVGQFGMGALVYAPDHGTHGGQKTVLDLDYLGTIADQVMEDAPGAVLEELVKLNGSSAGARPKAMIGVDRSKSKIVHGVRELDEKYEHWLVKFPNSTDGPDSGAIEFAYSQMAQGAGIEMMETHLFKSQRGPGYFGTKRFDRAGNNRIHLHTAAGLLHADFRAPSLDYKDLCELTMHLTRNMAEVEKMFRLAVFNVLGHNRDDHGKNFSFLMDARGQWRMSPAYDLIYSSGPRGEQSTMVMGEGRAPAISHLMALAGEASIAPGQAREIIEECRSALSQWQVLAKNAGVSARQVGEIGGRISTASHTEMLN